MISWRSGIEKTWFPPDGRTFSHVALSDSATIAMITSGELHVTDHVRDDVQTFPLASTNVKKISASGDTVAILQSPSPEDDMQVWLTI